MLALCGIDDGASLITAGVENDKFVSVTARPLARQRNHAVAHHDSGGNPWIPRFLAMVTPT